MNTKFKTPNFSWIHHYFKLSILLIFVVFIPLILAILLCLNLFYLGIFTVDSQLSYLKIWFWLSFIFIFFGFFIVFTSLLSYFNYKIVQIQISNYFRLPTNKRVFFRMELPEGFIYDTRTIGLMMKDFFYGFVSKNINFATVLKTGKFYQSICFDYVVEAGRLSSFVTFSHFKQEVAIEIFKKHFPQIKLIPVPDPFQKMPKAWDSNISPSSNFDYDSIAGSVISNKLSNFYGTTTNNNNPRLQTNIVDFLEYLGAVLPQNKFVLQYIFTFDNNLNTDMYAQKYDELATKNLGQYSPIESNKADSSAMEALIPEFKVRELNEINDRLRGTGKNLVRTAIKIVGFSKSKDRNKTEKALDKAIQTYFQENSVYNSDNQLQKAYLTSTNQTYFNHSKLNDDIDNDAKFMIERMVYLPGFLESYFSSFYNQYYYPRENKWREISLYECFIKRARDKPWADTMCVLDFDSLDKYFQIPISRPKPKSNLINNKH